MIPETFKLCTRPAKYKCRFVDPEDKDYWLVVWSIEDVKEKAREDDLELTDEQAREILRYFEKHYECIWETSWELMCDSIRRLSENLTKKGEQIHA